MSNYYFLLKRMEKWPSSISFTPKISISCLNGQPISCLDVLPISCLENPI